MFPLPVQTRAMPPFTSSLADGVAVPIPTFPPVNIAEVVGAENVERPVNRFAPAPDCVIPPEVVMMPVARLVDVTAPALVTLNWDAGPTSSDEPGALVPIPTLPPVNTAEVVGDVNVA